MTGKSQDAGLLSAGASPVLLLSQGFAYLLLSRITRAFHLDFLS